MVLRGVIIWRGSLLRLDPFMVYGAREIEYTDI